MRIILGFMLWAALAAHAQWDNKPLPAGAGAVVPYDTLTGRILFAAGYVNSLPVLFTSGDEGATWQSKALDRPILKLFTRPAPSGFLRLDGDLYAVHLIGSDWLAGFRCEMRRSSDSGATWSVIYTNSESCNVVPDPGSPQLFYATGIGESGAYLARSSDGGATWVQLYTLRLWASGLHVGSDGTVYALVYNLSVSRDRGDTWIPLLNREQAGGGVNAVLAQRHPVYGDKFVIAATTNGIWLTKDAGVSWQPAGLQGFDIQTLNPIVEGESDRLKVVLGFRDGVAVWTETSIAALANGLPAFVGSATVTGGRYVTVNGTLSICADLQSCVGGTLPHTESLVEFRNSTTGHYFMTLAGAEADALDQGAAGPGWARTGRAFKEYADARATPYSVRPSCRFYGTPGIGPDSHFYSLDERECAKVKLDQGWTFEAGSVFAAQLSAYIYDAGIGKYRLDCKEQRPVYRLYNNRFAQNDSNHRYVDDLALYEVMQAQGWKGEGMVFCALP